MKTLEDYTLKIKPFTYSVGEGNDGGTLSGLAKLVYGDKKMWTQIYAANRDVVSNPNALSYGMSLTIPASHPPEPKRETKVLPPYPSEAASQHVHGEVAMDVTLNDDGTYGFVWSVGNSYSGTGTLDGSTLTVDWGDRYPVIYTISDDGQTMTGTWANGRGTETLTKQ